MAVANVLKMIQENEVRYVDLRFTDTRGKEQHVTVPAHVVDEEWFERGHAFDGSSIAGWKGIQASDMLLMPDPATANIDPFFDEPTLFHDPDLLMPGDGRADMDREGVQFIARLIFAGPVRFYDQVLFIVADMFRVRQIEQEHAFASRRIAGDGLGSQVERDPVRSRFADDACQQGRARWKDQIREHAGITGIVEDQRAGTEFDFWFGKPGIDRKGTGSAAHNPWDGQVQFLEPGTQLLHVGPLRLDGGFTLERRAFCPPILGMTKLNRSSGLRIFSAATRVMRHQPLRQIIRNTGVQTPIGTFHHIHDPFLHFLLCC